MSHHPPPPSLQMNEVLQVAQGFFRFLLVQVKWFLLLLVFALGAGAGFYAWQAPKYAAKVSFILEEKAGGMGAGLSGLASQFGVDLGGLSGGAGLFAGDNVLDILKSRTIIEKVLLSKVNQQPVAAGGSAANNTTLADLYLDASGLRQKWANKPDLAALQFNLSDGQVHSRLQDSVLFVLYEKIAEKNVTVARLNKKGSIIEVETTSRSEVFSKLFTERLVHETLRLYVDLKTSVAQKNIQRLESRSDSLMQILNAKSYKSAALQVLDANAAYKSTAVPVEVSQREKSVTYALYSEVMKNLEASRMSLASQTPVINVLDQAKYPLENQKLKPLKLAGLAIGAALVLFVLGCFVVYKPAALS